MTLSSQRVTSESSSRFARMRAKFMAEASHCAPRKIRLPRKPKDTGPERRNCWREALSDHASSLAGLFSHWGFCPDAIGGANAKATPCYRQKITETREKEPGSSRPICEL